MIIIIFIVAYHYYDDIVILYNQSIEMFIKVSLHNTIATYRNSIFMLH